MRSLREKLSRVLKMSSKERQTRLAQEVHKRVDLAFYRVGLSSQNGAGASSGSGNFFFNASELAVRISSLKEKMPGVAKDIISEADDICRHRFRLLGYEPLDYGNEIDWHFDAVHQKQAPFKPWFKIDFLNSDHVGDHKVIWELNRHQHLVTLAKAWRLTGDDRYVIELQKQWHSWQRANPYPMGINWGSSLEVAFRSLSWLWVLALTTDSAVVPQIFRDDLVRGLAVNGRHIEKYLSTYFSPNTHLLGEAAALFFIGTMCPQISSAVRWRTKGWRILTEEAEKQVRADGVYFEQSLYYHVYALDFFLHARVLATKNEIEGSAALDTIINKMLDVVNTLAQAGPSVSFGDDDGGRVFNPRRNRSEHMSDPLALGAVLYNRPGLNGTLTEEAIWLFGEQAISFFAVPPKPPPMGSNAFKDGGVYAFAGNHRREQMTIDAGPQGTGHSGHGHADALSVSLTMDGRPWLVDPGTFEYMGRERDSFRGTGAHNTLLVDGLDQAIPNGPFAWQVESISTVRCDRWITGKTFTFFAGSHDGYLRLADPICHRRFVFYLRDQFWLVRDVAEGAATHDLEIAWHFANDLSISSNDSSFVAAPSNPSASDIRLALLPVESLEWKHSIESDYVSPAYGKRDSASTVKSRAHIALPAEHATLIALLETSGIPRKFTRLNANQGEGFPVVYQCKNDASIQIMIFAPGQGENWEWKGWKSDAEFLYFKTEAGHAVTFILCHGRFASRDGKAVIDQSSEVEWLEWNGGQVFSSDPDASKSFLPNSLK